MQHDPIGLTPDEQRELAALLTRLYPPECEKMGEDEGSRSIFPIVLGVILTAGGALLVWAAAQQGWIL